MSDINHSNRMHGAASDTFGHAPRTAFLAGVPSLVATKLLAAAWTFAALVPTAGALAQDAPPAADQIAGAVQAAPEPQQAGAGVLGFDESGAIVLLRAGTNELLCLADDPTQEGFQVACYHRALEPFMARGRALKAEGVESGLERVTKRWEEVKAGELAMPEQPTTLHILQGDAFDPATATVDAPYRRWVIYTPYATAETSGLPTTPTENAPWLMMPGTPSAHIMISPPRPVKEDGDGS